MRQDGAYANLVLPELIESAGLDTRDAAFATELTYGTLRLRGRHDAVIDRCVNRPLDQVDPGVLDVLRLGTHQLLAMRVPSHAAVSATVDLATTACGRGAATFVNAVLRRVGERDAEAWLAELTATGPDSAAATPSPATLASTTSHPEWIVKAMRQALLTNGRDAAELPALLQADNVSPEVTLCARPGLIEPAELASETPEGRRVEEQLEARRQAAADKLAQIRESMKADGQD